MPSDIRTIHRAGRAGRLARAAAASVLLLPLVGCAQQPAACERGSRAVEDAVRSFLVAGQRGDLETVQAQVLPGFTVTAADIDQLRDALDGLAVGELFLTPTSEMSGWYRVSAADQDGNLVGLYEVGDLESEPGCFAVYWGTPDESDTASPTSDSG